MKISKAKPKSHTRKKEIPYKLARPLKAGLEPASSRKEYANISKRRKANDSAEIF